MKPGSKANLLIHETSPYLLQHAYNPVAWQAWNEAALSQAMREDKPILLSIGYSTCHWCHVMERESFEDKDTADYMNEYFVCIKLDREERPDLDQIYMDACQIMTGNGGWPLNCFLTPDGRPFFAGTYYPPMPAYQRPSWMQVLRNMHDAWVNKRDVVEGQAQKLMQYITDGEASILKRTGSQNPDILAAEMRLYQGQKLHQGLTQDIFYRIRERFDRQHGGFGHAPKFPSLMTVQYLLEYAHLREDEEALEQAVFTLEKMIYGGIYDQLGGAIARYSTDDEWLAPHFEKMLYDNALFVSAMSMAVRAIETASGLRGKQMSKYTAAVELFKKTIRHTLDFTLREMSDPASGAYYSAFDADSEGIEGKFYVWSKAEVMQILGEEVGSLFCAYYDVTEDGNWEHSNILRRLYTDSEFASKYAGGGLFVERDLPKAQEKLLSLRARRIPPSLDDKVLLAWNALMVTANVDAYRALGTNDLFDQAIRCLNWLLEAFVMRNEAGGLDLKHTWKDGLAKYPGFLDDYAYLIAALIDVYEMSTEPKYLEQAMELTKVVLAHFDKDGLFFYYTNDQQTDVIARKMDLYDNATPSANSTMMLNLQRLGHLLEHPEYMKRSGAMLEEVSEAVKQHPLSFARWAVGIQREAHGIMEIAILGPSAPNFAQQIGRAYLPNAVLAASLDENDTIPLLKGKIGGEKTFIYLCRNFACQRPVEQLAEFFAEVYTSKA